MREVIGTIIWAGFILFIGYVMGKSTAGDELLDLRMSNKINTKLAEDLLDKARFIPKTELLKEIILNMREEWKSYREIGNMLGLHRTTIHKAVQRWEKQHISK